MNLPNIQDILNWKVKTFKSQDYASILQFIYTYSKENAFVIPEYQRWYVWTKQQQEDLIRSLFYWITIPPLILNIDEDNWTWTVIDWQQRITTLIKFFNDELVVDWIKFSSLNDVERRIFLTNKLSYLETRFKTIEEEIFYYKLFNSSWTQHLESDLNI